MGPALGFRAVCLMRPAPCSICGEAWRRARPRDRDLPVRRGSGRAAAFLRACLSLTVLTGDSRFPRLEVGGAERAAAVPKGSHAGNLHSLAARSAHYGDGALHRRLRSLPTRCRIGKGGLRHHGIAIEGRTTGRVAAIASTSASRTGFAGLATPAFGRSTD